MNALKSIVFEGVKPVTVHAAIEAFLKARKGTGGYENACTHMKHWREIPDKNMPDVQLFEVQVIAAARRQSVAAHDTCRGHQAEQARRGFAAGYDESAS